MNKLKRSARPGEFERTESYVEEVEEFPSGTPKANGIRETNHYESFVSRLKSSHTKSSRFGKCLLIQ